MIDEWGEKILIWLMEGPEARYNRGANPGPPWGSLEPHRHNILKQPWMVSMGGSRVYCTDHEALIEYLIATGTMTGTVTREDIDLAITRHTLQLMEG